MKKIFATIVLAIVSVAAFAQTSKDIYNKYSDKNNVSAVYISPMMFKMMKTLPDMHIEGAKDVNLASIVKSLDGMFVLSTSDSGLGKAIYEEVNKMVKAGKYELMLEAKDSGDVTRIYTVSKGDYITDLVLLSGDIINTTFVAVSGQIKSDDLAKILED